MRWLALALYALLAVPLVAAPAALADEENPDPNAPPTISTETAGPLPVDLRGVWLITGNGNIANHADKFRNSVEIDAIRGSDGKLDVQPFLVELPHDMQEDLDQANKQLRLWQPSPAQVDELTSSLEKLKPIDPKRYYRHAVKVVGPSHYQDGIKPQMFDFVKDGQFAMDIEHVYRPQALTEATGVQLMNDWAVYTVQKAEPTVIEGQHARTILAAGFLPVPVSTTGPFTMRRLRGPEAMPPIPGESTTGRLGAFLAGLLRGCR